MDRQSLQRSTCVPAFFVLGLALSLAACGGGGSDSGQSAGSPPTISAFFLSAPGFYINSGSGEETVVGSLDFADVDGDIRSLTLAVLDASGSTIDSATIPIQGIAGSKSGTIEGEFLVDTTTAGAFTVRVYLTDARDNRSNELSLPFRIAEFPWVAKRPMPSPRRDFATAALDGRIYVLGGGDVMVGTTPSPPVTTVEVYDPATDSWTSAPPMPLAVTHHVAVTVGGRIYVIGGMMQTAPMLDTVLEYDPATQLWTTKAPMPTERHSAAATALDGEIYVMGGSSGGLELSSVEVYDPGSDSWRTVAPLAEPRSGLAAATLGRQVLALGGYGITALGGYSATVEAFDAVAGTWAFLADMPVDRADFAVGVLDGSLFAAGGGNVARALPDVYAMNPAGTTWTAKTFMPSALAWPRAGVVGGRMYVFDTYETLEYTPGNDLH